MAENEITTSLATKVGCTKSPKVMYFYFVVVYNSYVRICLNGTRVLGHPKHVRGLQ